MVRVRPAVAVAVIGALALSAWACKGRDSSGSMAAGTNLMPAAVQCDDAATRNVQREPNYTAEYLQRWHTDDGCDVRLDYVMTRTSGCFNGVDDVLMGWPLGERHTKPNDYRIFIRDPDGRTRNNEPFDPDATLPSAARDTGLRWNGYALWLVPDNDDAIWLRAESHVERWPRQEPVIGCL